MFVAVLIAYALQGRVSPAAALLPAAPVAGVSVLLLAWPRRSVDVRLELLPGWGRSRAWYVSLALRAAIAVVACCATACAAVIEQRRTS